MTALYTTALFYNRKSTLSTISLNILLIIVTYLFNLIQYSIVCLESDTMRAYIELEDCKLLGRGAEGTVYLSPEGYVLKSFKNKKSADKESFILNHAQSSRFFPNVILQISTLIVREYVDGINLYEYLVDNGLSFKLSTEIIDFIEDLKILKFTRLNIRNAHIFINEKEELMVIDPRKSFSKATPYPKDIIKILLKLHLFDLFLEHLTDYKPDLLQYWIDGYKYVARFNKVSRYG